MIVSIAQPAYLPWLGYLQRIAMSDLHVVLDHVQLGKKSFTNRNRVRTPQGWCWLTVPLRSGTHAYAVPINELTIHDDGWASRHWATIRHSYARAAYFAEDAAFLERTYARAWTHLTPLCAEISDYLLDRFEIRTPRVNSADLGVGGAKTELLLNLCRAVGATTCLLGPLARGYLDEALFAEAGVGVVYHDFRHPVYPQMHGGFEPNMAAIDLLMNCGPRSRELLLGPTAREDHADIGVGCAS